MDGILENIQLIISLMTLGAMIFGIYKIFSDPDIKAKNRMDVMDKACSIKHDGLDKDILELKEDIKLIKVNHLTHMERDISDLKGDVKSILAILKDRKQR